MNFKNTILTTLVSSTLSASAIFAGCSTTTPRSHAELDSTKGLAVETYIGSENGFLVNSHLIMGPTEAILIDAQFTRSDAQKVVSMIQKSGRRLKTVFITHGHPDHYFGVETLRQAFPDTRYVSTEDAIADIQATGAGKLAYWRSVMSAEMPSAVPSVDVVSSSDLSVDGEELILKEIGPGESDHANVILVPSLKAAFTGDMVYDRVHLWLAEAVGRTEAWKKNLNTLKNNQSVTKLYVGHQKTNRLNDKSVIDENIQYIDRAVAIFGKAATAEKGASDLKAAFPSYSLPIIADIAAGAFIPKK